MRTSERRRPASSFRYSPLVAALACVLGQQALAATALVTSNGDSGAPGTLRGEITWVNANCGLGPHVIEFSGPFVIQPSYQLSNVTCPGTEIRGANQVVLDGSALTSSACALPMTNLTKVSGMEIRNFTYGGVGWGMCGQFHAVGNKIHNNIIGLEAGSGSIIGGPSAADGNLIYGNSSHGIESTGDVTIQNNLIGTADGSTASANADGIYHSGTGTGVVDIADNVISGNTYDGAIVTDAAAVTVARNRIGTNAAGSAALANGGTGIQVSSFSIASAMGVTISDNVVSGNDYLGVGVMNAATVTINGNRIGTNAAGDAALPNAYGLDVSYTYGGAIDSNVVSGNTYGGVSLYLTDLAVTNNKLGTDAAGGVAVPNGEDGLYISDSAGGTVGNNVISGNGLAGILLSSSGGILVDGNRVGTNALGSAPIPNGTGIQVYYSSGSAITIRNNVISGNGSFGVDLNNVQGAILDANKIGTDASGTAGIANSVKGVYTDCSDSLSISGNLVSSNGTGGGLYLSRLSNSTVSNNKVGTAADGTSALANNGPGITLEGAGCFVANGLAFSATDLEPKVAKVTLGGNNNLLDGNIVAHNNGDGIFVYGGTGHAITGGSIHSNVGKNINLDFYGGPLQNDTPDSVPPSNPPDQDTGPNDRQNYPDITAAVLDSGDTRVTFTLMSTPSSTFDIQFYSNTTGGVRAGEAFVDVMTVTTDASGVASGSRTFAGSRTNVTATATGISGTSEFSAPIAPLVPAALVLPVSIAFGNVVVGATSAAQEVTFTSTGSAPYAIDSILTGASPPACPGSPVVSICASGDFSCNNGGGTPRREACGLGTPYATTDPATVACGITGITFHPMTAGPQSTTIYICDNTSATPRAITFTGTGVPHVVTVSQGAHDFGNVSIGTQVASPSILVTNGSGNPPALLGTPIVAAPFSVGSNTCGSTLAPGASCNFTVVYAPTVVGPSTGTFSMTVDNGNPVVVDLQGAGVTTAVGQLPLPSGIDFGTAVLASAPLQHALTLQNTGNGPVTFSGITVTEPFQMSHNCPVSLAPSAQCTVNLSFPPLGYGNTTGQLVVSSDAGSGDQVVTLLATVAGTGYSLSPWAHSFGAVPVGSTSPPRAIAVSNNGENAIPLSGFSVTGPYTIVSNDCGASLAPASFCTAELAFEPVEPGAAEGTFTAQVGLTGAPPAVAALSGTGTQQAALVLPGAIDFGAILRGSVPSVSQAVELHNTGNATLTFSTGISGPFGLSGDCGSSLAPSASCTIMITFAPTTVGDFAGSLDIVSNAPGGSGSIPVTARVQAQPRADLRVDASEMGFGDRMIGTRSVPQRVTISNVGLVAAQLGVLPPSRDFIATSQCGTTLAPGASCTADVVFMPLATGLRYNQLQFTSDAPGSPFGVGLTGRGCSPPRPGRPPSCN